ncbi:MULTISPECIES: helix-turn-helix domain-containing protein [Nocardia]|uniref:helix-turn-helix domain-containing protein n=1 Tax=Nocardia TaxID=1817 RepID=UPI00031D7F92|nr:MULTISPECIES: helix-turn-helix domain-containing protein [Nocardia]
MIDRDNVFGELMRRLRERRGLSLKALAALTVYAPTTLHHIEQGERPPTTDMATRLDDVLQADGALLSAATDAALQRLLTTAAQESTDLVRWVSEEPVVGISQDGLTRDLSRIARGYVHRPPLPLLTDLLRVRKQIAQQLDQARRLQRRRELSLLGAVAVQLLGELTDDVAGNSEAAMRHAVAAELLAQEAAHPGLRAWVAGTKALIAEWSPQPHTALDVIDDAAGSAPPGDYRVRLFALQARCAGRLGDISLTRSAAVRTVAAAEQARDAPDEVTAFGGALTFPHAKMAYYLGCAYQAIGDHQHAERWALDAIGEYTVGPPEHRSYGDEALARVSLSLSRIACDEFEGAREILSPVLELPTEQRITAIMEGMNTVTAAIREHRHAQAPVAQDLHEAIRGYTTPSTAALA